MTDNIEYNEVITRWSYYKIINDKYDDLTRSISATFSLLASSSRLMAAACSSVESSCNTTRGDQLLDTWRSAVGHEASCWTRGCQLLDTRQPAVGHEAASCWTRGDQLLDTRQPTVWHEESSCWTRGSQVLDTRQPAVGHEAASCLVKP